METTQSVINTQATLVDKILYTGKVQVTGGRDGYAKSDDGRLQINLSSPGSKGDGTNPEQLFAVGWSACFIGALKISAAKSGTAIPENAAVNAEVDLAAANNVLATIYKITQNNFDIV